MHRLSGPFSRRAFLGGLAGSAVALGAIACSSPTPTAAPTKPAEPAKPAAAATTAPASAAKPAESAKPAAAAPSKGSAPAKIVFQTRGGDPQLKNAQGLIAEYAKFQPNHQVEIDHTNGDHFQKLQLGLAAGTPPDTYFDAPRTAGLAWKKNIVEDLEPYLKTDYKPDDYIQEGWICMVYDGKRMATPYDSGATAMFFNIDIFEKAGVPLPDPKKRMTWKELLETATKLTVDLNGKKPGETGFDPTRIQTYGFAPSTGLGMRDQWILANGGDVFDKSGKVIVDSPEAIEAYQMLADFGAKHFVGPSPEYKQANPIGFANGNVAMAQDGAWQIGRTNDAKVKWGVLPNPMNKNPASYGHYAGLSLTKLSKVKDATWTFMNWTSLSKDGQTFLYKVGLLQPTRKDLLPLFVDDKQPPDKQYRQVFVDELNSDTLKWPGQAQQSYYLGWGQYFIDAFNPRFDPVLRGKKQYKEIAADMKATLQKIVDTGEPALQ